MGSGKKKNKRDKIEDNPTYQKFGKNLQGAKALKQVISIFSPFSSKAKSLVDALRDIDNLEKQFDVISKSPDLFNQYFAELGWIAHESMNHDLMLECIELAKRDDVQAAEEKLTKYYTSEDMKWLTRQLKGTPAFQTRYNLIRLAYEDTVAGRFHASIPLVLMIIDGGVNDVSKSTGFFTETSDLTAWDSIAAHSSGLMRLKDILNKGRKTTNTDEIFLPYRNGILHGRDLSYANKYVAAKCWLTLIAINDWAQALKKNKANPPEQPKELSLKDSIKEIKNSLSDFQVHQEKIKKTHALLDAWKKRIIIIGQDIPSRGQLEDYQENTPERDAVRFLTNWQKNNFGGIARQISYYKRDINIGHEAGRVRRIFDKKILKSYELISIEDCAPAITEVNVKVNIEYEQKISDLEIKLRMIYQNDKNENLIFGEPGGEWKFIDSFFFHKVDYLL